MESRNISQLVFWCLIFFLSSELIRAQDFNALFLRLSAGEVEYAVVGADYDGATSGLYSTSYTYDKMGNPLRVSRYGLGTVSGKLTVPTKRLVDNLYYSYTGHHIRGIADRAAGVVGDGALDFASGGTAEEYEYDSNGNLNYDPDRGMAFTYDRNNMPAAIYSSRVVTGGKLGAMSKISSYSYDAAGVRQSVVHTIPATASGVVGGSIVAGTPERTIRRDYVGPMILLDNAVERILIPGGYIDGEGRYRFYLTDYQGNNRAVVDQQGTVVQRTDYYPYGLPLRQTSPDAQPYKYSGKEFDPINGLNTYDFHARAFFPDRILLGSPDIHDSDYPEQSIYSYCGGNPILFIDPTGMDRHHYDENGNFMFTESNDEYDSVVLHLGGVLEESEHMEYGTIEDVWRWRTAEGFYDYLKVRGDDNGKMLFEFFASHLDIEYTLFQCGQSGKRGLNFISTSHLKKFEKSGDFLFFNQLIGGYHIRRHIHNHPSGILKSSESDILAAHQMFTYYEGSNEIQHLIYTSLSWPIIGHYTTYSRNDTYRKPNHFYKTYMQYNK